MKDDDLLELTIEKLRWLRLPGMARTLTDLIESAKQQNLSALEVASRLADEEKASRLKSAVDRRVRDARFPEINTIDGFDFDFDTLRKKLKSRYLGLLDLSFIDKGINPLFIGNPGAGKTFLARSLAHRACLATKRVVFIRAENVQRGTTPSCMVASNAFCAGTSKPIFSPSTTSPAWKWTPPRLSSPSRSSASATITAAPRPSPPIVRSKNGPRSSPTRSTLRSSLSGSPSAANTSSSKKDTDHTPPNPDLA